MTSWRLYNEYTLNGAAVNLSGTSVVLPLGLGGQPRPPVERPRDERPQCEDHEDRPHREQRHGGGPRRPPTRSSARGATPRRARISPILIVCGGPLAFRNRRVHRDVNARQERVGVNRCSSAGFAGATDLWGGSERAVEAPFDDLAVEPHLLHAPVVVDVVAGDEVLHVGPVGVVVVAP
jgi:hypothetical protein